VLERKEHIFLSSRVTRAGDPGGQTLASKLPSHSEFPWPPPPAVVAAPGRRRRLGRSERAPTGRFRADEGVTRAAHGGGACDDARRDEGLERRCGSKRGEGPCRRQREVPEALRSSRPALRCLLGLGGGRPVAEVARHAAEERRCGLAGVARPRSGPI
jgi:hypothetical protein